jgi:hypothetical protein
MNRAAFPLFLYLSVSLFLCTGCFSALDPEDLNNPPASVPGATTVSSDGGPLVLVHYMPWYKGPASKSQENALSSYGGHWTGWGKINPTEVTTNGQAKIYAHQYPLTGPYDQNAANLLEYQAALMKIAGIDGVIFDWYGSRNVNDFGEIHEHAKAFVTVLKKAGLVFAVCYEDNTLNMEYNGKENVPSDAATAGGKEVFRWLGQNWFADPAYVKYEGRPVLLCFGPQYFSQTQWAQLFAETETAPYFVDLDNRTSWADASYAWPPMGRSVNGELSIPALQNYLSGFYTGRQKNKPYRVATAFPAFDDCYEDVGNASYGNLAYNNGETFDLTFTAAYTFNPQIIQIATWNDYGEGTIIEPTIERGYRELEYLQDKQKSWNPAFSHTKEDLRIPLEFYKLQYARATAPSASIAASYNALFAGNVAGFRSAAEAAGVTVDMNALQPLLRE